LVALGVGIGEFIASDRSVDQAYSARTNAYGTFDQLWNQATSRRRLAIVGLAAGGGLLVASGARALWLFRHQETAAAGSAEGRLSLAAELTAGGAALFWEGRF
jgi:hypothetical protein